MSDRISQEFYCTKSGGGCSGYFTANLNPNLNGRFIIVCPNCGHEHYRTIQNGVMVEENRFEGKATEEIMGNMGSFSKKPRSKLWTRVKNCMSGERNAIVFDQGKEFLAERWFELHGGKQ